ncbi:MAG: signal peptide peptidase SppA, partial [Ardenticatenaceae bacterium]
YLACSADEILLQPGGIVAPVGLSRELIFLKETLDEVGVTMDAVRTGDYKGSPDMFTRADASDELREMANWLADDAFGDVLCGIAEGRDIAEEAARELVDGGPYTDLQALEYRVVDGVLNEEGLPDHLSDGKDPARLAPIETAHKQLLRLMPRPPGRYVALIRVEGLIIPGSSRRPPFRPPLPLPFAFEEQAGDLTVVQAARALLEDDNAAAVVLYIDSPGGSSTSSEAMAAALEQLARKKPLVALMGTIAASGGYYVATPAQWIVAQPATTTGSIGVFTLKPVVRDLLDKLHIGREKFLRGRHAAIFDVDRPFDEAQREKMLQSIERTYDLFLGRVASGRNMSREQLEAVAGGRIWTGSQALERGLIDELGGFAAAVTKARQLAGLPDDAAVVEIGSPKHSLPPRSVGQYGMHYLLTRTLFSKQIEPVCLCPIIWYE